MNFQTVFLKIFQKTFVFTVFWLLPWLVSAQNTPPCGFEPMMETLKSQDPGLDEFIKLYEQGYVESSNIGNCENNAIFTLPVVFHIMHNFGPENISDAQIENALAQLNLEFAGGEGGFNTNIQFVKATIDPLGNCTSGINRIQTATPFGYSNDHIADMEMKSLSRWPTDRYLNIWIVKSINSISLNTVVGYGTPPGTASSADGMVMRHDYFGTIGTANGNTVKTFTHEMGHYLSLYHVWGEDGGIQCHVNDDCLTAGDRVCDTPPCVGAYYGSTPCQPVDLAYDNCHLDDPDSPYPVKNYMGYAAGCMSEFTECQSYRMKYCLEHVRTGLWSPNNLICTGSAGFYGKDVVIENNTTWTIANLPNGGDITIFGKLTIKPNPNNPNTPVTLNIGPGVNVHFCSHGKLIIEPNAILDLSGTLTSSCKTSWKGVEVWGDNSLSQYVINGKRAQGKLIGREGSAIENADIGAQLWGPDYDSDAGGQISCNGTLFRNNHIGVEFAPYNNTWPFLYPSGQLNQPRRYMASFSKCTFEIDDNYSNEQQFKCFLLLTGVDGVSVSSTSFLNNRFISSFEFKDWGYGILAFNAGFDLSASCNGNIIPCNSFKVNQFKNLGYGVFSANLTGNVPYSIQHSVFNGCFVGIYNKGISESSTLYNTFNLGNVPSTTIIPISPLGSPSEQDQVGVIFENSIIGISFEENDFNKVNGNVTNTVGSICSKLGSFNNVVRKNRYNGISHANVANYDNAVQPTSPPRGLTYECNSNTNVRDFDFLVRNGQIRFDQGLFIKYEDFQPVFSSAGNTFSYSPNFLSDFKNLGYFIKYYYNPNGNHEVPLDFSGAIAIISSSNDCQTSFCNPPCLTEGELQLTKRDFYTNNGLLQDYKNTFSTSPSSFLYNQIGYYQNKTDQEIHSILPFIIKDTINFNLDTIRKWIGNIGSLEGNIWLAADYSRTGELSKSIQVLNNIPLKYILTSNEEDMVNDFKSTLEAISDQPIYHLSEGTLTILRNKSLEQNYAGGLAQNILSFYGEHYPPAYLLDENVERSQNISSQNTMGVINQRLITVAPNPSPNLTTIKLERLTNNQDFSLRLFDMNGREYKKFESIPIENDISIHFSVAGIYYYQLINKLTGKIVESGKIVISN